MSNNDEQTLAIQELQVKVAFLEDALAKLSDEYFEQQKEMQQLSLTVDALIDKLSTSQDSEAQDSEASDERPPHY